MLYSIICAKRVTSAQRLAESSILDTHTTKIDGEPYWYYEYFVRKSPTSSVQESNIYRHYVAATAERDGYLYSLNASTLSKKWNVVSSSIPFSFALSYVLRLTLTVLLHLGLDVTLRQAFGDARGRSIHQGGPGNPYHGVNVPPFNQVGAPLPPPPPPPPPTPAPTIFYPLYIYAGVVTVEGITYVLEVPASLFVEGIAVVQDSIFV
ncbi:hypothetical protein Scep_030143 [Stephania cephalantha]|uniref:PsbP C-terminal domain-containing protein n=1 Tax=Stephania cephalantha TaxID=152367 RepID=A0AAP0E3H9_9MAGN